MIKRILKIIFKHKKNCFWFIIIFFLLIFSTYYFFESPERLAVDFLDVGQGDASLIKEPGGKTILIDGGPDNKILKKLGASLPYWKRKIDLILVSHFHEDHILGLIEIIKRYKIGLIILPSEGPASVVYDEFLNVIKNNKINYIYLNSINNIEFSSSCYLKIIPPTIFAVKADDNNSLISQLDCQNKRFLFSGDNNIEVEKALMNSKINLKADVFKASHHGSVTANSLDFLEKISPKQIIISVGRDNRFKHPSPIVIENAQSLGIEVYRTDQIGNIEIITKY
jgi:competence protein ComEC